LKIRRGVSVFPWLIRDANVASHFADILNTRGFKVSIRKPKKKCTGLGYGLLREMCFFWLTQVRYSVT
jgi:hypothetical protein